jgi:hypothetical protein
MKRLRDQILLSKNKKHDIDVLVDEIYVSEFADDPAGARERLSEGLERLGDKGRSGTRLMRRPLHDRPPGYTSPDSDLETAFMRLARRRGDAQLLRQFLRATNCDKLSESL